MGDIAPSWTTCTLRWRRASTRCAARATSPMGRSCRITLLGAGLGGRPHRRHGRRPRRPLPAPRLAAERRLRRRRRGPVRLPRLPLRRRRPLRRDPGARRRRRRSRRRPHVPRRRTPSSSATGWCGWRPRAARCADHRRARVGRPGVRRRPAAGPGVARRGGADGRQLPRPRPLPVHPHSARSAIPTTSRCRRTRSSATASAFTCDYVHSTKRLADSMGAEEFAVADRADRRGGTPRRSRSGCASSTRPTTSC